MNLYEVADEISRRLTSIFLKDEQGHRPVHGSGGKFQEDPHWKDYPLCYQYFHGDTGVGVGASHQTGWTGAIAPIMHLFGSVDAHTILDKGKADCDSRQRSATWGKAMSQAPHPSLYQINARVWMTELSGALGRPATLDDVPDAELDRLADLGFTWDSVPKRSDDGTGRGRRRPAPSPSGGKILRPPCRICARRISPARDLRSPPTRSIRIWAVTRRWLACASGSISAVSG